MKSGLIIFNTLAVTLRTDDTGRRTHDIVPPLPYTIKLTGELKTHYSMTKNFKLIQSEIHLSIQNLSEPLNLPSPYVIEESFYRFELIILITRIAPMNRVMGTPAPSPLSWHTPLYIYEPS